MESRQKWDGQSIDRSTVASKMGSADIPVLEPEGNKPRFAWSAFLVGLSAFIFVPVGGRISIAELILVCVFLLTFTRASYYVRPVRWLILAFLIMSAGLIISGTRFGVGADKFVQVGANYTILVLSIVVIAGMIRASSGKCIPYLLSGAACGQLIGFAVSPTASALVDPWKFSIGWTVTVLVMLAAQRFRHVSSGTLLSVIAVVFLIGANFMAGSRSTAILVAVCAFFYFRQRTSRSGRSNLGLIVLGIVGLLLSTMLYEYTADQGFWGPEVKEKLRAQSGSLGILFGARKELVLLLNSWLASPVLGWGPAAAVPIDVRASTYSWYAANGYEINYSDYLRLFGVQVVPLHSVLLGSLVQAGVFALCICGVLAYGVYTAVKAGLRVRDMATLFVALSGGVHVFTSPLGDSTRFPVALCIAIGFGLWKPIARERSTL